MKRVASAFSLIEVMAAVAMLTVIIIGLVAMFGQVRRAFTQGVTQVDYLEAGRGVADLVVRDLEQAMPAYYANVTNFYTDQPAGYTSFVQPLNVPPDSFTNWIQEVYFLTKNNQTWNGVGYKVVPVDFTNAPANSPWMIGSLYRYSAPGITVTNVNTNAFNMMYQPGVFTGRIPMITPQTTNRIIDGVVDFRLRFFDTRGQLLGAANLPRQNAAASPPVCWLATNLNTGDVFYSAFTSNALPAFVEVELAVLESRTYEHFRSLLNPSDISAATNYLAAHAAQVHVFRQRVALRNADPSAYP